MKKLAVILARALLGGSADASTHVDGTNRVVIPNGLPFVVLHPGFSA